MCDREFGTSTLFATRGTCESSGGLRLVRDRSRCRSNFPVYTIGTETIAGVTIEETAEIAATSSPTCREMTGKGWTSLTC